MSRSGGGAGLHSQGAGGGGDGGGGGGGAGAAGEAVEVRVEVKGMSAGWDTAGGKVELPGAPDKKNKGKGTDEKKENKHARGVKGGGEVEGGGGGKREDGQQGVERRKRLERGGHAVSVVKEVDLVVKRGELCVVMGPVGSGSSSVFVLLYSICTFVLVKQVN